MISAKRSQNGRCEGCRQELLSGAQVGFVRVEQDSAAPECVHAHQACLLLALYRQVDRDAVTTYDAVSLGALLDSGNFVFV